MTEGRDSRLQVIGLGHVGLPLAILLAGAGCRVRGVDTDAGVRERVARGRALASEAGMPALLAAALDGGALEVAGVPGPADCTIIAVPTPARAMAGGARAADLDAVRAAAAALAPHLADGDLVVLTSTSPIGTTETIAGEIGRLRPDAAIEFAYAPERVLPGAVLAEMVTNDRLVGGLTPESGDRAADVFRRFARGRVSTTDARTAEMVKLAENASRDVAIAFANELAGIAEDHGLDPARVIAEANRHPRVDILRPGIGVGGHCIPVDPWFLQAGASSGAPLMRAARAVNDARPGLIVDSLLERLPEGARLACLGLSYKPDVADFRESPAMEIARSLTAARPGRVVCHDPGIGDAAGGTATGLVLAPMDEALDCDAVVVLVPHGAYARVAALAGGRLLGLGGRRPPPRRASA